jgi:hypothetical protein
VTNGQWQDIDIPWYESRIVNCDRCGQGIARRLWVVAANGGDKNYCSEVCGDRDI